MNPRLAFTHLLRFSFFATVVLAASARAEVTLHGLFTDNMVLQRDASVPIWGWAADGEQVTVEFRGQRVSTKAKGGKWMVRLKKLTAGGPEDLKVTGRNSITLHGVLVGEVWIASGQSNMEMALRNCFDTTNEIAKTANPMLRLYTVPKLKAEQPTNNVPAAWQECNPSTTPSFSAVAYYFSRDLQKALGVPVGVIHTSWGGSPCEVWIREEVLASNKDYKRDILDVFPEQKKKSEAAIAAWEQEKAAANKAGEPFTRWKPGVAWRPSELYNGMIAPIIPYAIKGAIWYQGESNAGRAHQYRTLFPDMVSNWRHDWGEGNFTFLQVQLAPFMAIKDQPSESAWAELREAQNLAMEAIPKVGVAVITDVGEEKDIHPKKKEPVGARLALAARHIAYGEQITWSGPTYRSVKFKDGKAIVSFDHVGSGLEARSLDSPNPPVQQATFSPDGRRVITHNTNGTDRVGDVSSGKPVVTAGGERTAILWDAAGGKIVRPLRGFAIAGADKNFVWATAVIDGDKVIVSSPEVARPVAVRYGWADFPVVNLWNKDGRPASPFRTDNFPMLTEPKKQTAKK